MTVILLKKDLLNIFEPNRHICSGLHLLILRLQTGMRGAFGKPQGTVARVNIGQVIMSVRTKAQNKEHVVEALRRAKFKFPGRQKVKEIVAWFPCVEQYHEKRKYQPGYRASLTLSRYIPAAY